MLLSYGCKALDMLSFLYGYSGMLFPSKWSSQTLMDICLSMLSSGFKFIWTNPTEMLVSTGLVGEQFDVV